jgi:hypothetical protein
MAAGIGRYLDQIGRNIMGLLGQMLPVSMEFLSG